MKPEPMMKNKTRIEADLELFSDIMKNIKLTGELT